LVGFFYFIKEKKKKKKGISLLNFAFLIFLLDFSFLI